jgi:hypothetical protein
MTQKSSHEYLEGELELILSLAPTSENIQRLAKVLNRSESALQLVYRAAYGHRTFPEGRSFNRKVFAAKRKLGLGIGRKTPRLSKTTNSHE